MHITSLSPLILLVLPSISASLATDAFTWANELVSSSPQSQAKNGEVHTMDSWSYVDCGASSHSLSLSCRSDPMDLCRPRNRRRVSLFGRIDDSS